MAPSDPDTMLAALYPTTGSDQGRLSVTEVSRPQPAPGEVLVRVRVSGVNPTDWKNRRSGGNASVAEEIVPNQDGAGEIVAVGDDAGRRLSIWIGPAEATWMALILEEIELPRPGVYQFTAALLAGAGTRLREVRISELTESAFYAEAILEDQTSIDARPSDALTLALVTGAPIYVSSQVLQQAELTSATRQELIDETNAATDDSRVIAEDAIAAQAAVHAVLKDPTG